MPIHAVIQKTLRITDPAIEEEVRTPLCYSESLAHFFGAAFLNEAGTGPESLSGASVTANFIRGDGVFGSINGSVSNNVAYVVLPSWCYRAKGRYTLTVYLNTNSVSRAFMIVRGRTMAHTTDSAVDPEHIIPSISELIAQLSACVAATESANTAASNANTKAGLADTAAANANNKASAADTAAGSANTAASAANSAASNANAAAAKINDMTVSASGLTAGSAPTANVSDVNGHKHISFGIPKGDKGDKGDTGDTGSTGADAAITQTAVAYQNSASGTTVPTGEWLDTQPTTPQGQFLWTRTVLTWNNGQTTTLYSVSRQGVDGVGAVVSVNNIQPDANGNVAIANATQSADGLMASTDKTKLDGLPSSAATQSNMGLMSAADKTKLDGLPSSAAVPGSIAIVAEGDTHGAVTSGQYVYVREHGTLSEGLYKASANIAANAALSSSNLAAVPSGGMNAVGGEISDALNARFRDMKMVYVNGGAATGTYTYQMKMSDFVESWAGAYLIVLTGWDTAPHLGLYLAGYTGQSTGYSGVATIISSAGNSVSVSGDTISVTCSGKVTIYAL